MAVMMVVQSHQCNTNIETIFSQLNFPNFVAKYILSDVKKNLELSLIGPIRCNTHYELLAVKKILLRENESEMQ